MRAADGQVALLVVDLAGRVYHQHFRLIGHRFDFLNHLHMRTNQASDRDEPQQKKTQRKFTGFIKFNAVSYYYYYYIFMGETGDVGAVDFDDPIAQFEAGTLGRLSGIHVSIVLTLARLVGKQVEAESVAFVPLDDVAQPRSRSRAQILSYFS